MTETSTEQAATRPRHALRRHASGRYHTGLIPVAAIIEQYKPTEPTPHRRPRPIAVGRQTRPVRTPSPATTEETT
jgi:hypothetical protein